MAPLTKLAAVVTCLCVLGAVTLTAPADSAILAEHRVEPTRQGVTAYLNQLRKELAELKKAEELLPQLGDKSFRVREAAIQRLIDAPTLPLKALQRAAGSADPEVATRAKRILSHSRAAAAEARAESWPWISAAVFRTIQNKPIRGAAEGLLGIIPLLDDPELLDAASEAVAESAGPEDAPLLRRSLVSKSMNLKIAAIRGLGRADVKAEAELRALMDDAEVRLTLAAAHTLAQRGDRTALAVLIRLGSSKDEHVRARSEQILRAWTGRNFGFNPFLDPATQKESLERWRTWAAAEGRTAKLNQPLRLADLPEGLRRRLLLHYTFDQTELGKVTDSSGHRRHGTVHNAHSLVPGVAGKALEVRGAGEMGDQGGHVGLPFIDFMALEQFTVALWVYERDMTDMHGEAYVVFGADRTVGVEDSLGISHFNNDIFYRIGGAHVHIPFEAADRNRWNHYALTYQDGRMRAYKNRRLVRDAKGKVVVVGKQAALGRHWWHHGAATSTRFIGAFDEMRIYERALSPSQIEQLNSASDRKNRSDKADNQGK